MKVELSALLSSRNEYRILALMLALLHFALWGDPGGALARSLMLAHVGLFFLWQPLWNQEIRLKLSSALGFIATSLAFIFWLDFGLMTFWLLMLIGFVGGRVTVGRTDRLAYLATLLYLLAQLLIRSVPMMFGMELGLSEPISAMHHGLLALPLAIYFLPTGTDSVKQVRVDFLYGLLISTLVSVLAMGGLLNTFTTRTPYVGALFQTVLAIATFLLVISWIWSPVAGFGGLGRLWERYLLNIGTPFEAWLAGLARSAQVQATPQQFLQSAFDQLTELPWVTGCEWSVPGQKGRHGQQSQHAFHLDVDDMSCTVYARLPVRAPLLLHGRLLIHLVAHFYQAKRRELELTHGAHMQAIYETGARLTHDIKNLLQSLHTMAVALARSHDDPAARRLVQRQLPIITQRLTLALDKLQAPGETTDLRYPLRDWWSALIDRHAGHRIEFEAKLAANPPIPSEFFDSVIGNLLDNARIKRQHEPAIDVRVTLEADAGSLTLSVLDTGSPVDEHIAEELFRRPVTSSNGLGIGLYQSARKAEQMGYELTLDRTFRAGVRFVLSKSAKRERPPHPLRRRTDFIDPYAHLIAENEKSNP